jgi:hypothetical protein
MVARRRIVHITSGRRKAGRDRIMEICGALHHVWVRFTSWQQMVEAE